MSTENTKQALKQKTIHELWELAWIFLYLAFFFCSLELYSVLLLKNFHLKYLNFGFALINALVVAKIILLGEYARLGRKYEERPLIVSAGYKALVFVLLVFAFHFLEELIKRFLHSGHFAGAFGETHVNDLLGRSVVVFCTFLPLFAFRELRRVLGEERFKALFFRSGASAKLGSNR
ncbi:MAG: hypothetical protein WA655_16850 [Candidatus Korobacteraceae bacterium]